MDRKKAKPAPSTPAKLTPSVKAAKETIKKKPVSLVNSAKTRNLSWAQVAKRTTDEGASGRKTYNFQPFGYSISSSTKDEEFPSLQSAAKTTNTVSVFTTAAASKSNADEMYVLDDFGDIVAQGNRSIEVVVTSDSFLNSMDLYSVKVTTVSITATNTSVTASSSKISQKDDGASSQRPTIDSQPLRPPPAATTATSLTYTSPFDLLKDGIPSFLPRSANFLPPNMLGMSSPMCLNVNNYPIDRQMHPPPGLTAPTMYPPPDATAPTMLVPQYEVPFPTGTFNCDICKISYNTFCHYEMHLLSPLHREALQQEDDGREWKYRRPPKFMSSGNYRLCKW